MKRIITTSLALITAFLVGCGAKDVASAADTTSDENEFKMKLIGCSRGFELYEDTETCVQYIKYSFQNGVAITPRINSDSGVYQQQHTK